MNGGLKAFITNLVHTAIQYAIQSSIWRLPLGIVLVLLCGLIAIAIVFHLY
jgi:hypothetical protein